MIPAPVHSDGAHAAITAELVRLTLPHPPWAGRPALLVPGAASVDRHRVVSRRYSATRRRRPRGPG